MPADNVHDMSDLPEVEIDLDRLRARDPEEVTKVVMTYGPVLKSVFWGIAVDRHDLADIVNDFWIHIVPRLDRYSGKSPFGPWLVRCAKNFRNSRARKNSASAARTATFKEHRELVVDGSALDEEVQRQLLKQAVFKAVDELPGLEGHAVTLTMLEGRSKADAAKMLNVSPATVANLVRRGLFKLQENELLQSFHDDM